MVSSPANPLFGLRDCAAPLPLDAVKPEHFLPAVEAALDVARERVKEVADNPETPTFENTVMELEEADEWLDHITAIFYHFLHVDGSEEIQKLSEIIPPKLSRFRNDVIFNRALFARLETLETQLDGLNREQATAAEQHVLSFRRNGASLTYTQQSELRKIDEALSVCGPQFADHVRKATQAFSLWVGDEDLIAALPDSAVSAAKAAAKADGRPGAWKFTLDAPSYIAFMTYAPDAALRKKMALAYAGRCVEDEFATGNLIRKILDLRHRRAGLLGYTDHVHYTLERRMAGSREALDAFYEELIPIVLPAAKRDLELLRTRKEKETGAKELHPWDYAYYAEKIRRENFALDQEALRPWFALDSVLRASFSLAERLFGIRFREVNDLPVNHPDVRCFRVETADGEREAGTLYIDPFPRSSKRPGAWMAALRGQGRWGGQVRRPTVAIVCNLTPPVDDKPSLCTMEEARTVFHEMGHALHELLSDCECRSVAGTNVFWDFVELPSQLLENWLLEPDFLRQYMKHYQTGEPLPEEQIQRIQSLKTYQKGYQAARQLSFGCLDLAWHSTTPSELGEDLIAFERKVLAPLALFPPQPGTAISFSFQHIFAGGYAAGYYSYKWAEVLEADVFSLFRERGLFDTDTAKSLKDNILSKGGSDHPMKLFVDFRGREPDTSALLKREGLIAGSPV